MEVLLASVIAVVGTLLGSATTYLIQQHSVRRAEEFARGERLRDERMATYSAFAGALTEHRRALVSLWFRRQEVPDGPEHRAARAECDRMGAALDSARFRVQLVAGDPDLVALAGEAHKPANAIRDAADIHQMRSCVDESRVSVGAFITAAAAQILGSS